MTASAVPFVSAEEFSEKVIVVTGAAWGIGRATALLFGSLGATVVGIDRDEGGNADLRRELHGRGVRSGVYTADVGDRDAVRATAAAVTDRHGSVHVLFNNAGAALRRPLEATDDGDWAAVVEVNLTSVAMCTTAFLPGLERAGNASVVINASIDGLLGNPHFPAYSTAKGGLIPLAGALAVELARLGIRVNCITPGGIRDPRRSPPESRPASYESAIPALTPLRRRGAPEEVAAVVAFLGSDEASGITGTVIPIDGGRIGLTPGTL